MTDVMGPAAVMRAILTAQKEGDLEAALRFIASDSLDQGRRATREDWRRKWQLMQAGSPDMVVTTERSLENGEWIANRYTIHGTHTGDLFGQPPTGRRFQTRGMDMVRVRDGQLIEHWAFAEPLSGGPQGD